MTSATPSSQSGKTTDVGDFYYHQGQQVWLSRSPTEVVVQFTARLAGEDAQKAVGQLSVPGKILHEGQGGEHHLTIIQFENVLHNETMQRAFNELQAFSGVNFVFPVFLYPATGARMLLTDELIVKLKHGLALEDLLRRHVVPQMTLVRPMFETTDEYVLRLQDPHQINPLEVATALVESGLVEWAVPNFVQEYKKFSSPNDTLFPQQWHLHNTGQGGGLVDADVNAPEAWDIEQGRATIVIAVIDDGTQTNHPDLVGNIFTNTGEIPGNSLDDDGNGYSDDRQGWDFFSNDNDANPAVAGDNHGTAVSGVAAAHGNNAPGVSGACQRCQILPVKIFNGGTATSDARLAEAIRYAAQFADVLNNSWGGGAPSTAIQSAIQHAVTNGRGGKGAVVLFASGNSASGLASFGFSNVPAGTHRFIWQYVKDGGFSAGDDTAWMAWVSFPGPELVDFDPLPTGWTTGGNAPWAVVTDPIHTDEGLGLTKAVKAGTISHSQTSSLQVVKTIPAGNVVAAVWVSSESGFDGLVMAVDLLNDGTINGSISRSGVPLVNPGVSFPAAFPESIAVGASSNVDFRSYYSQVGPQLAFVAPSNNTINLAITTTDRTGSAGYDSSSDYTTTFGGTSSATPLASGVAGLILSRNPTLTRVQVLQILQQTADKIGPEPYDAGGRNNRYGHGRINAQAALLNTPLPLSPKTLTVTKSGAGSGTVTSAPPGITCGADCTETYAHGTNVTLTPTPDAGAVFSGWSGAADCSDGAVTLTTDLTCTATFALSPKTLTVTKSGAGSGTVTSAPPGITCGADCTETYAHGTNVTLTPTPDAGAVFSGWSGAADCSDGAVTLTTDLTCTATFALSPKTLTVSKAGTGDGTVTSAPAGISCGLDCTESYLHGTAVTLTATATTGSTFTGWSGHSDCSDGALIMGADKTCTATFLVEVIKPFLVAIPDINNNNAAEVVVPVPNTTTGTNTLYVKDGLTGALLRQTAVLFGYIPVALEVLPDVNGNGQEEDPALVVLGRHPDTGAVRVQIRAAATGTLVRTLTFRSLLPHGVAVLPDLTGEAHAEVAVLEHNPATGENVVDIKDSVSGVARATYKFLYGYTPYGLTVIPDTNGNGQTEDPALVVLGRHPNTGAVRVQIRAAATGVLVRTLAFRSFLPHGVAVLPDLTGEAHAEVTVLAHNPTTQKNIVEIQDSVSGVASTTRMLLAGHTPYGFGVIPDRNGDGQATDPAVAALGLHPGTGAMRVQVREAKTGTFVRTIVLAQDHLPVALAIVQDLSGNGVSDLAILEAHKTTGALQVEIRETNTGSLLNTFSIP